MANRIDFDPAKIPCPDFSSNLYDVIRNALIADANTPDITNNEQAILKLRSQWEAENANLRAQYQAQLQEEQVAGERRRADEEESTRQREAEERDKEAELAKEMEKKRTPLPNFKQGVGHRSVPHHYHPYAEKLMTTRKYVPLWYFLPDAEREARERMREVVDNNRFEFESDPTSASSTPLTLISTTSVRASPNALPDLRLTWNQVMRAKSGFLGALSLGAFPDKHVDMFAQFFVNMEMHPELRKTNGERTMALYQAETRLSWYKDNEKGDPFDLAVIMEETLDECRNEIRSQDHAKALKGMSSLLPSPTNSLLITTFLHQHSPFQTTSKRYLHQPPFC
ncbi:hypothetical protein F5879DRAFT_1046275 [Lentinula edodes]|nr:hypothetical protein F5879DRAFT_1046275 [Lentinula edodes]